MYSKFNNLSHFRLKWILLAKCAYLNYQFFFLILQTFYPYKPNVCYPKGLVNDFYMGYRHHYFDYHIHSIISECLHNPILEIFHLINVHFHLCPAEFLLFNQYYTYFSILLNVNNFNTLSNHMGWLWELAFLSLHQ